MEKHRTHYFPDSGDRVITVMLPTGEYGAYRDNEDDGRVQGTGHTRLAAIADMVENLSGFDARFIYDENEIDAEGEE